MGPTKKQPEEDVGDGQMDAVPPQTLSLSGSLSSLSEALDSDSATPYLGLLHDPQRAKAWEDARQQATDDRRRGAEQRTRETHVLGHEPLWLARAKELYAHLGSCISLISYVDYWRLENEDVRAHCETQLKKMMSALGGQEVESFELLAFLNLVDAVARRSGPMKELKGPADEGLAVAVGVVLNNAYGLRLLQAEVLPLIKELLECWPIEKPRAPGLVSKWELATKLWGIASGRTDLTPKSVRVFLQKRKRKSSAAASDDV